MCRTTQPTRGRAEYSCSSYYSTRLGESSLAYTLEESPKIYSQQPYGTVHSTVGIPRPSRSYYRIVLQLESCTSTHSSQ
jgi:hypothetical protein